MRIKTTDTLLGGNLILYIYFGQISNKLFTVVNQRRRSADPEWKAYS